MIDIKKLDGLYQQHLADQFPDNTKMMREWVGLTDKEILQCYSAITKGAWDCIMYARVIEAKLREKNHEPRRQYKNICGND